MEPPGFHYFIGGGIAALAGAVFLIRDAGIPGSQIRIFEALGKPGGSLDGSGTAEGGYLTRGGRMFEEHFQCTRNLLAAIPSPDFPDRSIWTDILAFNREIGASSHCRLVRNGACAPVDLGLGLQGAWALNRLLLTPERWLGNRSIGSCFPRRFFESNFWMMWSSMFSFQPWHSAAEMRRYMKRFMHLFPLFPRLEGILRTRYNQYDAIIAPVSEWLETRGVRIDKGVTIDDLEIARGEVTAIHAAGRLVAEVRPQDRVYITLGSMTDASTTGDRALVPPETGAGPAWDLWRRLAARYAGFGHPEAFCSDTGKTRWHSFTVTTRTPDFLERLSRFTGNRTGTGGLVTFPDSGWLLSIVAFHQPHFRNQPPGAQVFWGYGLRGDRPGDRIKTPMWRATGEEILQEVAFQLRFGDAAEAGLADAAIVTCRMPYITSQFMPRRPGDRPEVIPAGARNFAVIGQFCELPRDTVFTVEYSVRSAMAAVAAMNGTAPPPPVKRTDRHPKVLFNAARTLADW